MSGGSVDENQRAAVDVDAAYRRLPTVGPHEPSLGSALITWVEPMSEHVVGYNRWYEDDHMITGAMVMPWMFACRRFVAPRWLQHLRGPVGSRVAQPLEAGKYIGIYSISAGRLADHEQWTLGANCRLHAEGRGSYRGADHDPLEERRHVFTGFCDYLGATYRDDGVPRDVHTLQQPYAGLVVELIDAVDGLVTVLHFLDVDPPDCRADHFAASADRLDAGGVGALASKAAFVPTKHGTDAYSDELF